MTDIWPQSIIPPLFCFQSGATFGYSSETRGKSIDDFPATQQGSDLIDLKSYITGLLMRTKTTVAIFITALHYLEAVRPKITEIQKAELEGRGTRGEPITCALGRITVDPECIAVAGEEDRKLVHDSMSHRISTILLLQIRSSR